MFSALLKCACVTYVTMTAKGGIERLLFAYCDGLDRGDLVAASELFGFQMDSTGKLMALQFMAHHRCLQRCNTVSVCMTVFRGHAT